MWSEWTDQHRLPNIALYGRVEGNRVKGRLRKRWLGNVTDDFYHRGWSIVEATRLATDRQRWRTYIRLPQRAPASPWQQQEDLEETEYGDRLLSYMSPVYWPLHKHQYTLTSWHASLSKCKASTAVQLVGARFTNTSLRCSPRVRTTVYEHCEEHTPDRCPLYYNCRSVDISLVHC